MVSWSRRHDTRDKGTTGTHAAPDHRDWIIKVIRDFVDSPANTLQDATNERAWDEPLIGFSRGDDPLYAAFKEHVGPEHWTPLQAFQLAFPDTPAEAADLSVIVWILPQTEATRADNRRMRRYPAERWARSRIFGEDFNNALRLHVAATLTAADYAAVTPFLLPQFGWRPSARFFISSNWSERHAAFTSGQGTFGLCDGLITPLGKAVRIGTVVARIQVPPTPRPYTDHHAYCLHYANGTCGECIKRCPVGAISERGHDKLKCRAHLERTKEYVPSHYGFAGYGCGLCQTGVACESGVPEGIASPPAPRRR